LNSPPPTKQNSWVCHWCIIWSRGHCGSGCVVPVFESRLYLSHQLTGSCFAGYCISETLIHVGMLDMKNWYRQGSELWWDDTETVLFYQLLCVCGMCAGSVESTALAVCVCVFMRLGIWIQGRRMQRTESENSWDVWMK
jgi:hypothetical protein